MDGSEIEKLGLDNSEGEEKMRKEKGEGRVSPSEERALEEHGDSSAGPSEIREQEVHNAYNLRKRRKFKKWEEFDEETNRKKKRSSRSLSSKKRSKSASRKPTQRVDVVTCESVSAVNRAADTSNNKTEPKHTLVLLGKEDMKNWHSVPRKRPESGTRLLYGCQHCCYRSKIYSVVIRHVAYIHCHKRPFMCDHCDASLSSRFQWEDHLLGAHGVDKDYPCPCCGEIFQDWQSLDKHSETQHLGEMLEVGRTVTVLCKVCGMYYTRSAKHKQSHEQTSRHRYNVERAANGLAPLDPAVSMKRQKACCPICDKVLDSVSGVRRHVLSVHNKVSGYPKPRFKVQCQLCKVLVYSENLRSHMLKMHPNTKSNRQVSVTVKCPKCFTVVRKQKLEKHLEHCKSLMQLPERHKDFVSPVPQLAKDPPQADSSGQSIGGVSPAVVPSDQSTGGVSGALVRPVDPKPRSKVLCKLCKVSLFERSLQKHMRTMHRDGEEIDAVTCPKCSRAVRKKNFDNHLGRCEILMRRRERRQELNKKLLSSSVRRAEAAKCGSPGRHKLAMDTAQIDSSGQSTGGSSAPDVPPFDSEVLDSIPEMRACGYLVDDTFSTAQGSFVKCSMCSTVVFSERFNVHLRRFHRDKIVKCPGCFRLVSKACFDLHETRCKQLVQGRKEVKQDAKESTKEQTLQPASTFSLESSTDVEVKYMHSSAEVLQNQNVQTSSLRRRIDVCAESYQSSDREVYFIPSGCKFTLDTLQAFPERQGRGELPKTIVVRPVESGMEVSFLSSGCKKSGTISKSRLWKKEIVSAVAVPPEDCPEILTPGYSSQKAEIVSTVAVPFEDRKEILTPGYSSQKAEIVSTVAVPFEDRKEILTPGYSSQKAEIVSSVAVPFEDRKEILTPGYSSQKAEIVSTVAVPLEDRKEILTPGYSSQKAEIVSSVAVPFEDRKEILTPGYSSQKAEIVSTVAVPLEDRKEILTPGYSNQKAELVSTVAVPLEDRKEILTPGYSNQKAELVSTEVVPHSGPSEIFTPVSSRQKAESVSSAVIPPVGPSEVSTPGSNRQKESNLFLLVIQPKDRSETSSTSESSGQKAVYLAVVKPKDPSETLSTPGPSSQMVRSVSTGVVSSKDPSEVLPTPESGSQKVGSVSTGVVFPKDPSETSTPRSTSQNAECSKNSDVEFHGPAPANSSRQQTELSPVAGSSSRETSVGGYSTRSKVKAKMVASHVAENQKLATVVSVIGSPGKKGPTPLPPVAQHKMMTVPSAAGKLQPMPLSGLDSTGQDSSLDKERMLSVLRLRSVSNVPPHKQDNVEVQEPHTDAQESRSHYQESSTCAQESSSHNQESSTSAQGSSSYAEASSSSGQESSTSAQGSSSYAEASSSSGQESSTSAQGSSSYAQESSSHNQESSTSAQGSSSYAEASSTSGQESSSNAQEIRSSHQLSCSQCQKPSCDCQQRTKKCVFVIRSDRSSTAHMSHMAKLESIKNVRAYLQARSDPIAAVFTVPKRICRRPKGPKAKAD